MKTYLLKIDGQDYQAKVLKFDGTHAKINVNGTDFVIEIDSQKAPGEPKLIRADKVMPSAAETIHPAAAPAKPAASAAAGLQAVNAPIPGIVIDVKVKVGDTINAGDVVVVLEAMKMESDINASAGGTIKAVHVNKGDSVTEGQLLVEVGA